MNNKYRVWCLRNNCWHPGEGNVPTYYDAALAFSEQVADTEVREYPTPPAKVEGEWTYKFDDDDNRFYLVKPDGDWILSLFVDSVDPSSDRMVKNTVDAINTLAAENARLRAALTDFAEFGCRHDTNPTTRQGVGEQKCREWYTDYIASMDSGVRQRAHTALGGAK
jgi:hypothetical protein